MSSFVLGIDLGTTNSCASVFRQKRSSNGKLTPHLTGILTDFNSGEKLVPSIVSYDPDNDMIEVGLSAKNNRKRNIKNTIFEAKRFIGRDYTDKVVQKAVKDQSYPFDIVRDNRSFTKAAFKVQHNGITKTISPEEIATAILRNIRDNATKVLGVQEITKAVVTVPAYFDYNQRWATKNATINAGFIEVNLINEPTAAVLSLKHDDPATMGKVLVFDFGDVTLDVSIVDINGNSVNVIGTHGNYNLGGCTIDQKIVEHCLRNWLVDIRSDLKPSPKKKQALREAAEKAKKALVTKKKSFVEVENFADGYDLLIPLARDTLDALCHDIFAKCISVVDHLMDSKDIQPEDIDIVQLVGGHSRLLRIQQLLDRKFPGKLRHTVNPDESVVVGAAVCHKYEVNYVTPYTAPYIAFYDEHDHDLKDHEIEKHFWEHNFNAQTTRASLKMLSGFQEPLVDKAHSSSVCDLETRVFSLERELKSTRQHLEEERKNRITEIDQVGLEKDIISDKLEELKTKCVFYEHQLEQITEENNQLRISNADLNETLQEKTQEIDHLESLNFGLNETSNSYFRSEIISPLCPVIESSNLIINYNQELGHGGFAIVYAAKWFSLDVAVKIVDIVNEGKAKLHKEIGFLTKLNYPCVLRVFGITYINNQIGIVMERADGKLQIPSTLGKNSLTIAKNICCTLKFLQSRSIIHGDIKPDNVLIVNGQIRLADFGTSRVIASNSALPSANAYTAKYAALEVLNEEPVKESDIYSIGVLLFELLTNEVAFRGFNQYTLLGAKYQGKGLKFSGNVPRVLVNLIKDCMSNEISDRPNIDHILEILESLNV
ncbi:hypothetical protein P9112_006953 [Eukaryota sp. TZLM1-RC]